MVRFPPCHRELLELNGERRVLLNLELFDGARELYGEHEAGPADELVPRWFAPPEEPAAEARPPASD